MLKSRVGAEWVRAPTEIRSTPVSAIARTVSRVDAAGGLERRPVAGAAVLVAQADRLAQGLVSMLSSRSRSAPVPSA